MSTIVICSLSAALLLQLAVAQFRRVRATNRRESQLPPALAAYPSVTVIRPVKGTDVEQEENFRAALDTGYPGEVETIFVFEDATDPGLPAAEAAIAEHVRSGGEGVARIVFAGPPSPGRTGKISNMIAGVTEASDEILAFGDSDTRPDRQVLRNLVEHLVRDERAGAAFAPAVASSPPRTAGDVGHAVILNAFLLAEAEKHAGPGRELPFLIGHMMVFRRSVLDEIGGIECADGRLVDDMYLGAQVAKAGRENVMGTHPLSIIGYGLRFGDFARMWRRWLFCGRAGIPPRFVWPFVMRAVSYFLLLGLTIAALAIGPYWLALPPAVAWLGEGLHQLRLNRAAGGPRIPARWLWMAWMPYLVALPIIISMLAHRQLKWRGHIYRLDLGARLDPKTAQPDSET